MKKTKLKGFTLMEFVIVLSLIVIMLAIAIPAYSSIRLKAQVAAHNANVDAIKTAALLYIDDNPEASEIKIEDLKAFLDKPNIVPGSFTGEKVFTVTYSKSNSVIKVKPGYYRIVSNKAEAVED